MINSEVFWQVVRDRAPRWNGEIFLIFALTAVLLIMVCSLRRLGLRRSALAVGVYTYVYNVLVTTLFMREQYPYYRYTLRVDFIRQIFVEHSAFAAAEGLLNFLMLLPLGLALPFFFKRYAVAKTCAIGGGLTVFIEVTQLAARLGELQADDLILNYAGCMAGAYIYAAISTIYKRRRKKRIAEKTNCYKTQQ